MAEEIKQGENFFDVDGLRMHGTCAGRGKNLILLHGLGGPLMLQRLIQPLAIDFCVVVVDLPGFGDSESSTHPLSTGDLATLLSLLFEHLHMEKTVVAGVSYGGQLAVELATVCPERVEKLVLIASTGLSHRSRVLVKSPFWSAFSLVAKSTVLQSRRLMCRLGSRSFHDVSRRPRNLCGEFYRQLSKPGGRDAWLNMLRNVYAGDPSFPDKLARLHIPTAIVWGANDRTVPPACARDFKRILPSATLAVLPECGHSVPLEKSEELSEIIRNFGSRQ